MQFIFLILNSVLISLPKLHNSVFKVQTLERIVTYMNTFIPSLWDRTNWDTDIIGCSYLKLNLKEQKSPFEMRGTWGNLITAVWQWLTLCRASSSY